MKKKYTVYLEDNDYDYLETIKQKNGLKSISESVQYLIDDNLKRQGEEIFTTVLIDSLTTKMVKTIKDEMRPLFLRTQSVDKQSKMLMNIVNHYLLVSRDPNFIGDIFTTNMRKAEQIEKLEERYKEELAHYKQQADYKKAKRQSQTLEDDEAFGGDD